MAKTPYSIRGFKRVFVNAQEKNSQKLSYDPPINQSTVPSGNLQFFLIPALPCTVKQITYHTP
mgnify:CR=1 FL=1